MDLFSLNPPHWLGLSLSSRWGLILLSNILLNVLATSELKLIPLKCKKTNQIATLNARSQRSPHKQLELCALAKKYKIDIIGIQEHRIVHTDDSELQYESLPEGFQLVTASAWRNSAGASTGGVGVLFSPFANKTMISIKKISDRTLQVTFNGNPKTTVIVTYSATNVTSEDVTDYFNELNESVKINSCSQLLD